MHNLKLNINSWCSRTRNNGKFAICTNSLTPRFRSIYSNNISLLFTKIALVYFHWSWKRTKLQHSLKSKSQYFTKARTCISSLNSQLQCIQKSIKITIPHFSKNEKKMWHFSRCTSLQLSYNYYFAISLNNTNCLHLETPHMHALEISIQNIVW